MCYHECMKDILEGVEMRSIYWAIASLICIASAYGASTARDDINAGLEVRWRQSQQVPQWVSNQPQVVWNAQGELVSLVPIDPEQQRLSAFESLAGPNNVKIYQKGESKTYLVRLDFSRQYPSSLEEFHQQILASVSQCEKIWKGAKWLLWLSLQENCLGNQTVRWLNSILTEISSLKDHLRYVDLSSNSIRVDSLPSIYEMLHGSPSLQVGMTMNPIEWDKVEMSDKALHKRMTSRRWTN